MKKLFIIIVLFFSTSVLATAPEWQQFETKDEQSLKYWIKNGFKMTFIRTHDSGIRKQDVFLFTSTAISKPKDLSAIICSVTYQKDFADPFFTTCYRED